MYLNFISLVSDNIFIRTRYFETPCSYITQDLLHVRLSWSRDFQFSPPPQTIFHYPLSPLSLLVRDQTRSLTSKHGTKTNFAPITLHHLAEVVVKALGKGTLTTKRAAFLEVYAAKGLQMVTVNFEDVLSSLHLIERALIVI